MNSRLQRAKDRLRRLSFRQGVIVACACALCYLISFLQWMLPLGVEVNGALWAIFFGLAKTLQYTALLILGKSGVDRIRAIFTRS